MTTRYKRSIFLTLVTRSQLHATFRWKMDYQHIVNTPNVMDCPVFRYKPSNWDDNSILGWHPQQPVPYRQQPEGDPFSILKQCLLIHRQRGDIIDSGLFILES